MYTLGIETSCDETAASIVKDGGEILSNVVTSSLKFHQKYGGVVPEIAFRMQLETIVAVADRAIKEAGIKLTDVGLISVTTGPGLLGSLLVGISFSKAVSFNLNIPLIGINHLYSHIYASFLQPQNGKMKSKVAFTPQNKRKKICDLPTVSGFAKLPFVGLVVSGGHTSLFYVKDFDKIELIGRTLDDACGEAFDKVAKILGLGYPGGPVIERLAKEGNAKGIKFSCSRTLRPLDFSFSGIKTAVLYYVRRLGGQPANRQTEDIAASFQETVINVLVRKSLLACRLKRVNSLVLGGGVVANNRLRKRFCEESRQSGVNVYFPPKELSMDNAAMVAGLGYGLFKKGHRASLDLNAELN